MIEERHDRGWLQYVKNVTEMNDAKDFYALNIVDGNGMILLEEEDSKTTCFFSFFAVNPFDTSPDTRPEAFFPVSN